MSFNSKLFQTGKGKCVDKAQFQVCVGVPVHVRDHEQAQLWQSLLYTEMTWSNKRVGK